MSDTSNKNGGGVSSTGDGRTPFRVRLPGFVRDEEVGLGDLVKQVTTSFGVRPCGGCDKRAETLNRWVRIGRR